MAEEPASLPHAADDPTAYVVRVKRLVAIAGPLAAVACWSPRDTGPRSMVGVVLDADAKPIAGVSVETVEARSVTDAAGAFGVNYKEPTQHVFFDHGGLRYQRDYRPDDDGTVVRLQLPYTRPRVLSCDEPAPCEAALTWTLAPGFTATLRTTCDPGETSTLAMPDGLPDEVTCRPDTTAPAAFRAVGRHEGLDARGELEEGLTIHPPPVPLSVRLRGGDRPMPSECNVYVNDEPARRTANGVYEAQVWGHVAAWAVCDGILGTPSAWIVNKPAEVTLTWHRDTPTLDLSAHWPDVQEVLFAQRSGRGHGWVVSLPRREDGTWQLPRLVTGTYKIGLDAPRAVVRWKPSRPDMPTGRVFVEEPKWAEMRDEGGGYGVLELDAPVVTGILPVHWATEEYDFRDDVPPANRPR